MKIMKTSHNLATKGLLSANLEGSYKIFFCYSKEVAAFSATDSLIDLIKLISHSSDYFLNIAMTKTIWMWTLMMALPMNVAEKKVLKGMRKWPQVMPARSNKGFGMEAHAKIVQKPYFSMLSKMMILARSINVGFCFLFSYKTSSISSLLRSFPIWCSSFSCLMIFYSYSSITFAWPSALLVILFNSALVSEAFFAMK